MNEGGGNGGAEEGGNNTKGRFLGVLGVLGVILFINTKSSRHSSVLCLALQGGGPDCRGGWTRDTEVKIEGSACFSPCNRNAEARNSAACSIGAPKNMNIKCSNSALPPTVFLLVLAVCLLGSVNH